MAKIVTRSAFEGFTPAAQSAHIKNGGTVVDAPGFDHQPAFILNGLDRMRAGDHAQREWANRVAARYEDNGFPKMRPSVKQEPATGAAKPAAAASPLRDSISEAFDLLAAGNVAAARELGSFADRWAAFAADETRARELWPQTGALWDARPNKE